MKRQQWWMRLVGALYIFVFFAAAIARLPIRAEGPEGLLARADAHDATAIFVLDTWVTFGLCIGAVGLGLLFFSRTPDQARALVWTVMGMELVNIVADINKLSHGYVVAPAIVWMVIHTVVIVTGYLSISRPAPSESVTRPPTDRGPSSEEPQARA